MRILFFVLFLCFYSMTANAALPQNLSGREYSEAMLLLSKSDLNAKIAAQSIFYSGPARKFLLDLLAETTWSVCSGRREMKSGALSWLARTIGNTKQARYAGLIDYCLSKVDNGYLEKAKESLKGKADDIFDGGNINLDEILVLLQKKESSIVDDELTKQFSSIRVDTTVDNIFSIFGTPSSVSGINVPSKQRVGWGLFRVRLSDDLIVLNYRDLGTIRFDYDKTKSNVHEQLIQYSTISAKKLPDGSSESVIPKQPTSRPEPKPKLEPELEDEF